MSIKAASMKKTIQGFNSRLFGKKTGAAKPEGAKINTNDSFTKTKGGKTLDADKLNAFKKTISNQKGESALLLLGGIALGGVTLAALSAGHLGPAMLTGALAVSAIYNAGQV